MLDQQEPQKRPSPFDEAIVFGPMAVAIDEILELRREPADAGSSLLR